MADEQLKVFVDVVTNRAVSELKKLKKATEDTGEELEDTRTEAQKVADRIDAVTRSMVADMDAASAAADALGNALGPEMSAAIGRAGIMEFVADLKRAGLSAQDVEADADRLAQTLKSIDEAKRPLKDVDDHMSRIGTTTENSRSVLANFAGNAIAELPGVTDAMGPLNMAIGQFAEYAVDGNIKMSNFIKTAGGIGAAVIGMQLLGKVLDDIFNGDKDREASTKAVGKAMSDLAGDLLEVEDAYIDVTDASELLNQGLLDNEENGVELRDLFGKLGVSSKAAFSTITDVTEDAEKAFVNMAEAMGFNRQAAEDYIALDTQSEIDTLGYAIEQANPGLADFAKNFGDLERVAANTDIQGIALEFLDTELAAGGARAELVKTAETMAGFSRDQNAMAVMQAFLDLASASKEAASAQDIIQAEIDASAGEIRTLRDVLGEAIKKHRELAGLLWGVEEAQLATASAYDELTVKTAEWGDGAGDNAEELRNLRQEQIDVAQSVVDLSLKQLEAKGINADSVEGVQAQITELKRLQEQYPLVKGEIQKYIDELLRIPGTVNTNLTINGRTFGASEVTGPGGTSMTPTNPTNPNANPGGTTIIVNGALDPVAVADQIERIMSANRYRNGDG